MKTAYCHRTLTEPSGLFIVSVIVLLSLNKPSSGYTLQEELLKKHLIIRGAGRNAGRPAFSRHVGGGLLRSRHLIDSFLI